MQIKNPTKNDIKVSIKGIPYCILAEGTLNNVPEVHARQWQESLHKFLILRKDSSEKVEVKPTIPKEVIAEVKEPVVEAPKKEVKEEPKKEVKETIVEKVKKVVAKKTNKKK